MCSNFSNMKKLFVSAALLLNLVAFSQEKKMDLFDPNFFFTRDYKCQGYPDTCKEVSVNVEISRKEDVYDMTVYNFGSEYTNTMELKIKYVERKHNGSWEITFHSNSFNLYTAVLDEKYLTLVFRIGGKEYLATYHN